jgi:hypothetical protein
MEQRVESFKYSVKIESSYFAAGTKYSCPNCSTYPERNHNIVQLQNGNTRALKKCNIYQYDYQKIEKLNFS